MLEIRRYMIRTRQMVKALVLGLNKRNHPPTVSLPTNSRKISRLIFAFLGLSSTCLGGLVVYNLGAPEVENEELIVDQYSDFPVIKQYMFRAIKQIKFYSQFLKPHLDDKYLPERLDFPYIQPKYTLVLELTDVLVHPEWSYTAGWKFKKRPLLDYFLETLSGSFEIVVFTLEPGATAYPLLDVLDPKKLIAHRLVRDASRFSKGGLVKYLQTLNRDMSKIVYIDWNENNVVEKENLFNIKRWNGNDDDTSLLDLTSFLKTIADNNIEDVRMVLKSYSKFEDPIEAFRQKQKKLIDELEAQAEAMKEKNGEKKSEWHTKIFCGKK